MKQINQKLNSIITLAKQLESRPKYFGTDVQLTGTDIHLVEIIGDNKNIGVTDIARKAGVTKGAVSQKLKQLLKKGIVTKNEDPTNLSRYFITLTSKGKVAYFSHKHWHETMDGGFKNYYSSLTKEELKIIQKFLNNMEKLLAALLAVEE